MRSLAITLVLLVSSTASAAGGIDLHAHLFMERGLMNWLYHGCFECPLQAKSWSDRYSSKANADALMKSGVQVVVASLYAHPLIIASRRESIRGQIKDAEAFVARHPDWIIAGEPTEALQAYRAGKNVIILSLEGAEGILETEEDFAEFLDRKRIRIVTPLHLTDDRFGGAAFMPGWRGIANPWAWFKSFFYEHESEGVRANPLGLTSDGEALVHALIKRGIWIDLSHASDAAHRHLIPILKNAGQPLLYTHTVLRKFYRAERGIADWQIHEVRATGGVVGLMPSHEMLEDTLVTEEDCPGDLQRLKMHYRALTEKIGRAGVVLGTDFNAPLTHLKPGCPTGGDAKLDAEGFWNMSQSTALWKELNPGPPETVVHHFLADWRKTRPQTAPPKR